MISILVTAYVLLDAGEQHLLEDCYRTDDTGSSLTVGHVDDMYLPPLPLHAQHHPDAVEVEMHVTSHVAGIIGPSKPIIDTAWLEATYGPTRSDLNALAES